MSGAERAAHYLIFIIKLHKIPLIDDPQTKGENDCCERQERCVFFRTAGGLDGAVVCISGGSELF